MKRPGKGFYNTMLMHQAEQSVQGACPIDHPTTTSCRILPDGPDIT